MRGVVFRELPPQKQWEGSGEAGGRRPGPGWRCWRPASSAPGRGVSPGHRAQSRGVPARENRGRSWRRPGRRWGWGPSPPAGTERATRPGVGVFTSLPRRWPPASEHGSGSGRRRARGPRGEAGGGPPAPGWLAGLSPLPSSPPLDDAAPPDAAPAASALPWLFAARRHSSIASSRLPGRLGSPPPPRASRPGAG